MRVTGLGVDDFRVLENVFQFANATFHVPLLVLGCVVTGVFFQVAFGASSLDLFGNLYPTTSREVVKFGAKTVVCGAGQMWSCHGDETISLLFGCCRAVRQPWAVTCDL